MFPFFNHYPGTDLHEIDLAYLLRLTADLESNTKELLAWKITHETEYEDLLNKVNGLIENLVDVIVPWDSSVAYHIFSIVEYQGTNYIAIQDVPIGTMITNTDYWRPANTVVEQINAMAIVVDEVNGKVFYTTPQEYGAVADGVTDDTGAIAAAIATGKAVYIPEGVYKITAPFTLNNGQQIRGVGIQSVLRVDASFTGNYVFISTSEPGHFDIENLTIDCNDVQNVGGIYAERPYNACIIKNVLVNNCAYYGLYMGADISDISQTLVVDNCMVLGSLTRESFVPLAQFNRVYEMNLMNSKFMFRSAMRASVPCVICNNCWDLYIRGCSFTNTSCHGIELQNATRYFVMIGNTYEHVGSDQSASGVQPTGESIRLAGTAEGPVTNGIIIEYPYYSGSAARSIGATYTSIVTVIGPWDMTEYNNCYANSIINVRTGTNTTGSLRLSFDGQYLNLGRFTRLMIDQQNYAELRHSAAGQFEIRDVVNGGSSRSLIRLQNTNIINLQNNGALVLKDANGGNHFIRVNTDGEIVVTNS